MKSENIVRYLFGLIEEKSAELRRLSDAIWSKPELAYHETFACAEQVKLLREYGFEVTTPYCGIETSYRAEFGTGEPVFAIAAEYDALPDVDHGCGHNLIAAAAMGAAYAVKKVMEEQKIPGRLVIFGTPAEEGGGGKVKMMKHNCLDGIDAVMMVHPSHRTVPDTGSNAIRRFSVEFTGKSAHAAGSPELGLNALDAVVLFFSGINAWRQQIPEAARIHGIITSGGDAPNIIPSRSSCRIYLRSRDEEWIEKMERRFRDIVRGAELMTGTTAEVKEYSVPYKSRKPNPEMNAEYISACGILGMNPEYPDVTGRGSSDFGDFSQAAPGIHPYFAVSHRKIAGHSLEFNEAARSDFGFEQMKKAAAAMASVALRFMTDGEYRTKVKDSFKNSK